MNRDLNPNDLPQLQEMGVRSALRKPLSEELLYEKIIWIFQQERVPNTPDSLKRKVRRALIHEDLDKAQFLFNQFSRNSQVIPGDAKSLEAELALAKGEYEQSRDLAIEAMALGRQYSRSPAHPRHELHPSARIRRWPQVPGKC
ncbi:hypothetical protein [Pseudobacteriovorax antillogorgiicola]|uniref:Response regulatory domain-containing protein n=1 Tax=Pseudobacteriovorax antillogorgiicola TaxID=1513793 RepID=A0A1Y6CQ64_9BACT|nr:hypothetical protein [Pseudobacteriovorax antillogorgiicola]TCS46402.1 hypothetical protein EDD56_12466 [Pseudobacteriovorax antillogorgiicola]SMF68813.1 hypothetical protein SAMN06296036_12466 [Pseudobacteriovorax antillogorgiicola]